MDSLPQAVVQPLELLIYISLVLVLVIGIFLIKLLLDVSSLVNSLQNFLKVTQAELEPTIREINSTLTNINSISSNISNQVNNINVGLEKGGRILSDSSARVLERIKDISLNVKDNLTSVISVFMSNKK